MPIYDLKCEQCGEVTEQFLRFDMSKLTECHCGGKLDQLYNSAPALFMGKAPFCLRRKFTNPFNDGKKP